MDQTINQRPLEYIYTQGMRSAKKVVWSNADSVTHDQYAHARTMIMSYNFRWWLLIDTLLTKLTGGISSDSDAQIRRAFLELHF